ncbi:hypothetical protein [Acinetobacter sp. NIPH 2699]|uniref:hypothetical protein n=1 Tax=Acinetobacter sp. NIPH 2699 TaxID=2923433 RepID=UPI001F4AA646|nr:hypothetical protein [Acinetobacter sp. NIPH 2699]MCH7337105.1 hypothetical protein [Acinetobacter sp. NIPH 2699]
MINNYNTFSINKMIVFQEGKCALDINFLEGLNVIYGKNSAGKSSLLDVLIYSLGGEDINFTPIVQLCSVVYTEVEINENFITIAREINNKQREGLSIFYGKILDAISADKSEWHNFPYNSYNDKFGFSKIFFDYLNYPETVSSETSITTHQLLRILYADQANNHLPIFRYERWDNSEKRIAIRDYIFGLFSGELYEQQLLKKSFDKQLAECISRLQSFFKIVGKSSEQMIEEFIIEERSNLMKRKEILLEKLLSFNDSSTENESTDLDQTKLQNKIQSEMAALNKAVISLEDQRSIQQLEIIDLNNFVNELKIRLNELNNSITSNELITNIIFDFCPCCHSRISLPQINSNKNICNLCKSETSENANKKNLLQMKTELNFQIQESKKLISDEEEKLKITNEQLNQQIYLFNDKKQEFDILTARWHSARELVLIESYRELGEIDTELKNIESRLSIADEIKQLERKRDNLQSEISKIDLAITHMKSAAEHRLKKILNNLNDILKNLLSQDIGVQEEFLDPKNTVEVSFEDNQIYINGSGHFSQSSTIVLRHLFHLALLVLADQDSAIRIPRFFVLDGINDGGLEKDRAENLQKIITETCNSLENPFQLICSTSELFPVMSDCNKIEFLAGKRTFDAKLLS